MSVLAAAGDTDLTRPVAVIVVCSLIIVVTLVVQRLRREHPAEDEPAEQ